MQIFIKFIIVTITCAFITSLKIHGQVGINLEMRMLDVSIPNNAFNHDNTYATTVATDSSQNYIYLNTIHLIMDKVISDYPTLISNDTVCFHVDPSIISMLPKEYNNIKLKYYYNNQFNVKEKNILLISLRPIYVDDNKIIINFYIEMVAILNYNMTFSCCEGCTSGGWNKFQFDCNTNKFIQTDFSMYNCF